MVRGALGGGVWCVVRFGACGACDACDAFGCTVTGKYATSAPTAIGGVYSLPPAHFAEQAQAEEAEAFHQGHAAGLMGEAAHHEHGQMRHANIVARIAELDVEMEAGKAALPGYLIKLTEGCECIGIQTHFLTPAANPCANPRANPSANPCANPCMPSLNVLIPLYDR